MSDGERIAHFWAKNQRFARKSDERTPSPEHKELHEMPHKEIVKLGLIDPPQRRNLPSKAAAIGNYTVRLIFKNLKKGLTIELKIYNFMQILLKNVNFQNQNK